MENVGIKCLEGLSCKIGLLIFMDFWALSVKSEKVGGLFKISKMMKFVILLMLACGCVVPRRIRA